VRDRGEHREEESDRGGGGRGVITLATLTRRRPDSRSRSTRSTRLRLTYTPTLGLPLHLPLTPPSPRFLSLLSVALHHPASASSTSCLSSFSSSSFPARGTRSSSSAVLPRRTRRGSSEFTSRSPNPKAPTPERPNCSLRESLLRRREISDAMLYDLVVVLNESSPPRTSTAKFTVRACLCT